MNPGERLFEFDKNYDTIKNRVNILYNVDDKLNFDEEKTILESCEFLSKRLLSIEIEEQKKLDKLKKEIQKGMLIYTYLKMTETEYKLIISKADYDKFIEEITGNMKEGLPQKKKIFKSFIVNVSLIDDTKKVTKIVTYDSNTSVSVYWWKTFLELKEVYTDDYNTVKAYEEINKNFLTPLKSISKEDHLNLWSMTIGYFSSEGEFNFQHYCDEIVGKYFPVSEKVTKEYIFERLNKIKENRNFDLRFNKNPKLIRDKFKKTLSLTEDIDLVIKHSIPKINNTIKSIVYEGEEYIMIRSKLGYEYAKSREINRND